jgi:hypothetical protein
MDIPPCEYCGSVHYYVNGQARGGVKGYFEGTREIQEEFTDKIYFVFSDVVRCQNCNKINRNLYYDNQLKILGR